MKFQNAWKNIYCKYYIKQFLFLKRKMQYFILATRESMYLAGPDVLQSPIPLDPKAFCFLKNWSWCLFDCFGN